MTTTTPAVTTGVTHTGKRARVHKSGKNYHVQDRHHVHRLQEEWTRRPCFHANEPNTECLNCVSLKYYRACADTYVMSSHDFMLVLLFSTKYLFLIPRSLF
jgi:hypothetical protein